MDIIYLLGLFTFFTLIFLAAALAVVSLVLFVSLKTKRVIFPSFMALMLSSLESPLKALFRFFHLNDTVIDRFIIDLRNRLFRVEFAKADYKDRMVFLPQCLRSTDCPAKLSPEGIQCIKCGKCVIKSIKENAEELGYRVFVVPGSSFIKRMIAFYKPRAIVGVGCRHEVKDGLDMCDKYKIPGQGVVLLKSGCVNTIVNLEEVLRVLRTKPVTAEVAQPG
jgi:hypothetical protein